MTKRSMLKKIAVSVFTLAAGVIISSGGASAADNIAVNETNFPDSSFRSYVTSNIDKDANGILSASEISAVTSINVKSRGITNLTGIGYFTSLHTLNCSSNSLSSASLDANTELNYLNISNNALTQLSVAKNSKLTTLMCSNNKISTLDLTANTELNSVDIACNQLSSIDVSKCSKLIVLNVSENLFLSLDLSGNPLLNSVDCSDNQLTTLNLSANLSVSSLNVSSNQLALLDVKSNKSLTYLDCSGNKIMSLIPSKSLETLFCNSNDIYSIDLKELENLRLLNIADNKLYAIDVTNLSKLEYIDASNNCLASADLSANTLLKKDSVKFGGNKREIFVSNSTFFADLTGTSLDVSKMTSVINAKVDTQAASNQALSIGTQNSMPASVTYTYNLGNDNKESFTLVPTTTMKLVPDTKNISIYLSDKDSTVEYPLYVVAIGGDSVINWSSSNSTVAMVTNDGKLAAVGEGTATVTATADGFKPAVFTVNVLKQVNKVSVEDIKDQYYTGTYVTPLPIVKAGNVTLVKDTDYKVSYENNISVGTAVITIKGCGRYSFSVTKNFKICYNIASLTADAIADQMFTGLAITPNVVIKNGSYILANGTDFSLSYANNTAVGTGIVTITGIGKYTGVKYQSFNIAIPQILNLIKSGNSQKQIVLKWTAIPGVTGYRVYRYNPTTKKYAYLKQIAGSANSTYTDTGLTVGTEYRYRVRAYVAVKDAAGKSVNTYGKYSAKLKTFTKLKKVTLTVKAGSRKATLSWKKITGATGYRIYMKTGTGSFKKIKEYKKASTIKYTKSGLTKGKTYYFKIRAFKTISSKNTYGTYSTTKTVVAK